MPNNRNRPFIERRGDRWRTRWAGPDGKLRSKSGFADEPTALQYGWEQLGEINRGEWHDPRDGQTTVQQWVNRWWQGQNLEETTQAAYRWHIELHILPSFGHVPLAALNTPDIAAWEKQLEVNGYAASSARSARTLLHTILGDAVAAKLIPANPAVRQRGRGRKTGRKKLRPQRRWATPLEVLLIAERCAALSGRDDDLAAVVTLGWTGLRWAELVGLERDDFRLSRLHVDRQLYEHRGRWLRKAPKDDSYRNGEDGFAGPVDLPPFLSDLLSRQAQAAAEAACACCGYRCLFLTSRGRHHRRSNYARRIWRPACDGWYDAAEGKARPVLVDAAGPLPGAPLPPWPQAVADKPYAPPTGRGRRRPDEGAALASWLPIKPGLTPHGLRHGHKTWMAEDGVPEVLQADRLGHEVPGMRGVYTHVSDRMRRELVDALQERWEQALAERATLSRRSAVPLLDGLLGGVAKGAYARYRAPSSAPIYTLEPLTVRPETASDLGGRGRV